MDQDLHKEAVKEEVRWVGRSRLAQAALVYVRSVATRSHMQSGNPVIRNRARNAAQQ